MGVREREGERRRCGEMVGKEEEEDKNFYLSKKKQCNCIAMFNAIALECSMQLH